MLRVGLPVTYQLCQQLQRLWAQMMLDIFNLLFDGFRLQAQETKQLRERLVPRLDPGSDSPAFRREVEAAVLFVIEKSSRCQTPHHIGHSGRGQAQFFGHVGDAGITLVIDEFGDALQMVFRGVGLARERGVRWLSLG